MFYQVSNTGTRRAKTGKVWGSFCRSDVFRGGRFSIGSGGEAPRTRERLLRLYLPEVTRSEEISYDRDELFVCERLSHQGYPLVRDAEGAGNEKRCRGRRKIFDRTNELRSADAGHHDIRDNELDRMGGTLKRLQSRLPVVGR